MLAVTAVCTRTDSYEKRSLAADQAPEPFRKRVHDGLRREPGRDDDHNSVAAVLVLALVPGHPGPAEGLAQYPVEGNAQLKLNLVVSVRPRELSDVDGQHGTDCPLIHGAAS